MIRFILTFTIGTLMSFGQTLSVGPNSSININSNSSLSIDGLELAPNEAYTISGPNTLDRSNTPVVVGDNTSVSRVYELSACNPSNQSGLFSIKL